MKILSIIPARGGSKGIPRKNIKHIAGKPLIAYTIEASLKSKYIDRSILSTEDTEIKQVALSFGAEVMDRPVELAQDETKTAPVMIDVVKKLEHTGYSPDIIVLLQPTCPLRDEFVIDAALEQLINSDHDSIFTCSSTHYTHALWKKELNGKMSCLYDYHLRPRRQEEHLHQMIYQEDGALYAIRKEAFKECCDFLGNNPMIFPREKTVDIDEYEDFERAERLILERMSK